MDYLTIVLPIFSSAVTTLGVWLIQERYKRRDSSTKALRYLMKKELKDIHAKAMSERKISAYELGVFSEIYSIYHEMGGNGTGTVWKNDVERLPRKE